MSVFTPFRTHRRLVRTAIAFGGALKLAGYMESAYAQQSVAVNVRELGGVTVLPASCDNSTSINSSFFSIAGTGATNTIILSPSTAKSIICAIDLTTRESTTDVYLVSGDSTNCSTNSTIAGWSFSSASGLTRPNAGFAQYKQISSNTAVCIKTASSGPVIGSLTFFKRGD